MTRQVFLGGKDTVNTQKACGDLDVFSYTASTSYIRFFRVNFELLWLLLYLSITLSNFSEFPMLRGVMFPLLVRGNSSIAIKDYLFSSTAY